MRFTELEGVLFFEGVPEGAENIKRIDTEIGGIFKSSQLSSLSDIKAQMVRRCKALNGNAIIAFEYGQKSSGFLASIFSRDDVRWYGRGIIARISKPQNQTANRGS